MNPKKNKTFAQVIVWIMVIGLVGTFVPVIFTNQSLVEESNSREDRPRVYSQTRSPSIVTTYVSTSTTSTLPKAEKALPESLSGLSEEGQSVKDLDNLLNQ